jgi:ATP-dependent DNA helicase RecQ
MYANSHGKTMIDEGVHKIAQELRNRLGLGADAVGIHASTAPSICPECGSTTFMSRTVTGNGQQYGPKRATRINECKDCKAEFVQPKTIDNDTWQEQLEQVQDSFYRGDFPLMVATKSYGMGIDKRNIRFIIHHALAGGMEGYYQEAGRAGRDGKPAHIALVCKLPHRDCYEDYLLRELPPPCITDETNRQYNKCPYFTSGLCDAGRQAYFIANSYPGVEKDAKQVVSTYRALRNAKDAGLQVRTKSGGSGEDDAVKEAELALFRLQQLGLITNYTIEYQPPYFARLMVERCDGWDGDSVLGNLSRFLQHSGMTQEAAEHAVAALRSQSWERTQKPSGAVRDSFLEAAAAILLQRVYDRVPRMRYTMLSSLLRYAFNDQNRCRRLYIRTYFDAHPPDDNYRCEYCDACHPDLVFDRQEAVTPAVDRQLDYVTDRLHLILATFDSEELRQVVTTAEAKVAVVSLFEKVNRVLEDDATNVAALFLTGALARRQRGLEGLARERLRFAFAEGERQGLAISQLHAIYEEAQALDGPFAIELISRKQGAYDSPEGLVLLERAAAEVYGSASPQQRTVRSLRRVRALRTLHSDVALAAEAVGALQEQLKKAHLQD